MHPVEVGKVKGKVTCVAVQGLCRQAGSAYYNPSDGEYGQIVRTCRSRLDAMVSAFQNLYIGNASAGYAKRCEEKADDLRCNLWHTYHCCGVVHL